MELIKYSILGISTGVITCCVIQYMILKYKVTAHLARQDTEERLGIGGTEKDVVTHIWDEQMYSCIRKMKVIKYLGTFFFIVFTIMLFVRF